MQGNDPKRKPPSPADCIKYCKNGDVYSPNKINGQSTNRSFDKSNGDSGLDLVGITQDSNDGTDSGVEVIRALSSNGSNSDRFTPIQSCGSSLVSYSSEPEIDRGSECGSESSGRSRLRKGSDTGSNSWKPKKSYLKTDILRMGSRKSSSFDGDGTSESCSETSSIHESITPDQLNLSFDFNRSTSNRLHDSRKYENGKPGLRRSESVSRSSKTYEKPLLRSHSSVRTSSSSSSTKVNSNSKSLLSNRGFKVNGISKCENKGGKGRSDVDGRWSSSQRNQTSGARIRVSSVADPTRRSGSNIIMSSSMTSSMSGGSSKPESTEVQSNALDKYGTLPRRPKKKSGDLPSPISPNQNSLARSHSVTREPSLNRAATLRNQKTKEKENSVNGKTLPPYPKIKRGASKTIIYHEVSVQTVITNEDISNTGSGILANGKSKESAVEKENRGIQTEGKERLKKLEEEFTKQSEELEKFTKENEQLRTENRQILEKISKLLGRSDAKQKEPDNKKELEELEQHFQVVGLTVLKQQEELSELRRYKAIAHRDLEKSLAAQKNLLQQQQEIEEEYTELQEFLQAEKIALSESLLDTEAELKRLNGEIAKKESLLEQQQEECKHLVRICEQRRQENLSLEAKLAGLDQRSRDVLVQQGAAVSAAAVALSGLGARLDTLVEQLSVSCNISEKDLEDVIFHNEAYNKSEDNSPGEIPAGFGGENQKRNSDSFLQVILGAIRNAAQSSFSKKNGVHRKRSDQNEDRLSFFDAVSEPCLNLETTLDDNSFSNCTDFETSTPRTDDKTEGGSENNSLSRSSSLQNLSEAILNRQAVEKNERIAGVSSPDELMPIEVNSLVDQIIDVDNLVTKLLKVIKIIQEGSEKKFEDLKGERALLASQLHQGELSRQKLEGNMQRLQQELTEARCQLNLRISQLEEAKALCGNSQRVAVVEMQKRFAIIDNALGALNSVQDMVNKCPPLAQLRQELEDCNYENSSGDVNANSESGNGNVAIKQHNGAVLTTAI